MYARFPWVSCGEHECDIVSGKPPWLNQRIEAG